MPPHGEIMLDSNMFADIVPGESRFLCIIHIVVKPRQGVITRANIIKVNSADSLVLQARPHARETPSPRLLIGNGVPSRIRR